MSPVTQFLCLVSLAINIPVHLHLVHPYKFIFIRELVTKRYEIWRVFTSLFLGSSAGISYAFELAVLYYITEQLESGPFARRSADFAWQLFLVGAATIVACTPLNIQIFSHPFFVALSCLSSTLASPRAKISLMGLLNVPVKYMPYIIIGMDLLLSGPAGALQAIVGVVVGYLWWWTMWAGRRPILGSFGHAPAWLRSLV